MKFVYPWIVSVALLAATMLVAPPAAHAQWRSSAEAKALDLLNQNRLLTARRLTQEILKADPDSLVAHFVLGRILHESDGPD